MEVARGRSRGHCLAGADRFRSAARVNMRAVVMSCLLALVGCASGKVAGPERGVAAADVVPPSSDPRVSESVPLVPAPLPAPPDVVWRALPAAYDALGIQLNVVDPSQHLIGNQGMKLR